MGHNPPPDRRRTGTPADAPPSGPEPDNGRVDQAWLSFSDPTQITNGRFPFAGLTQVPQLGHEGREPLRVEATRLPEARSVEWDDRRVDTVASQFVACLGGRIREVAIDYCAQADDGSVWYFGEDVGSYEDGVVADHDGSWLAGRDRPPGMIIPADPQVTAVTGPRTSPVRSSSRTPCGPPARPSTGPRARSAAPPRSRSCSWTAPSRRRYSRPPPPTWSG